MIDVNANESCLQMATKSGKIDAVKALMNDLVPSEILNFPITEKILPLSAYKCNPTFIDDDGKSALEIAAETGNLDIFDYLLDSKIPYHNFDKYGNSCLHLASRKGYIEVKSVSAFGFFFFYHNYFFSFLFFSNQNHRFVRRFSTLKKIASSKKSKQNSAVLSE